MCIFFIILVIVNFDNKFCLSTKSYSFIKSMSFLFIVSSGVGHLLGYMADNIWHNGSTKNFEAQ